MAKKASKAFGYCAALGNSAFREELEYHETLPYSVISPLELETSIALPTVLQGYQAGKDKQVPDSWNTVLCLKSRRYLYVLAFSASNGAAAGSQDHGTLNAPC